jgi:butyrate kinase
LKGEVDFIILTGGIACNTWITDNITKYVQFIATVRIYPGEDEMAALATNMQMALAGKIVPKEYC